MAIHKINKKLVKDVGDRELLTQVHTSYCGLREDPSIIETWFTSAEINGNFEVTCEACLLAYLAETSE